MSGVYRTSIKDTFGKELAEIKADRFREIILTGFGEVVDSEFFIAPASATSKHHPPDDNLTGGLVIHTRKVVKLALEGMSRHLPAGGSGADFYRIRDSVIAAALLHDIAKPSTRKDDGEVAALKLWSVFERELEKLDSATRDEMAQVLRVVCNAVFWHAFPWTVAAQFIPVAHASFGTVEKIIQEADYYASRRAVSVNLGVQE